MKSYTQISQEVESLQHQIVERQQRAKRPPPTMPEMRMPSGSLKPSPLALPVAFAAGLIFERLTYVGKHYARAAAERSDQPPGRGLERLLNAVLPIAEIIVQARLADRTDQHTKQETK